ncbi:hypothetical protein V6N13_117968 [Hibiscus sabdariffa]
MNTRYLFQPDSLFDSSGAISSSTSSNSPGGGGGGGGDRAAAAGSRNRSPRGASSSFLIRAAMRMSRARWFTFLRRVFHYQNGSRSDLGSDPFNSGTWMMLEFLALVIQITITTFTLVISKQEKPVWPMRIWIVGYDIGCALSLLLLYGRYRRLHITQGDGLGLSDVEQQRTNEESRAVLRDMVCDGKRLGVRFSIQILPPSSEPSRALHLIASLECSVLLLPIPIVPTPMLLCATH